MIKAWLGVAGVLALSVGFAPGCGSEQEGEEVEVAQSSQLQGRVPKKMREITSEPRLVDRGKAVYVNCVGCHGKQGEGVLGAGPRLNSNTFLAAAADEWLIDTISRGREGTTMIPWGQTLASDDVYAVVAYIRSWNEVEPVSLDERPLAGAAVGGESVFRNICAGCHGQSGAGYQETANGTGIGRRAFLSSVSNGYLRYIIKHGKSGTKMRPFADKSAVAVANLNDQQIEDVIAYMRTNAW